MKSARAVPARSRSCDRLRAAGAMALAVVLSSCTLFGAGDGGAKSASTANPEIADAAPAELRSFYTQKSTGPPARQTSSAPRSRCRWTTASPTATASRSRRSRCHEGQQQRAACWSTPAAPAAPATTSSRTPAPRTFSEKVRANYDIVGLRPRGVKRSAPVTCLTDQERDASRAKNYDLDTDAGLAEALADNKAIAAKCAEKTGPVLGHVDTAAPPRTSTSCVPCSTTPS